MNINRTEYQYQLNGDLAVVVIFTKMYFAEDELSKTLAGYYLLPFAVGDCKDGFFYNDEVCTQHYSTICSLEYPRLEDFPTKIST